MPHKKKGWTDSCVSIFVFDIDGELINEFDGSSVLAISECRRHAEMLFEGSEYEGTHVGENKLVCPLSITQGSDGLLYICDGIPGQESGENG